MSSLPDVHFGPVGQPLPDWRKARTEIDEGQTDDDDDELLPETPPDVVAMLGFDPLELEHIA